MTNLDSMIAPRALTALELAQVASPHLIAYGLAHRAFIHTGTLQDDGEFDSAVRTASESALDSILNDAIASVGQWLSDMEAEGEPRFYRKASIKPTVARLCAETGKYFAECDNAIDVAAFARDLADRRDTLLAHLIEQAGR